MNITLIIPRETNKKFNNFALMQPQFLDGFKIRCPCKKCQNKNFHDENEVRDHLYKTVLWRIIIVGFGRVSVLCIMNKQYKMIMFFLIKPNAPNDT